MTFARGIQRIMNIVTFVSIENRCHADGYIIDYLCVSLLCNVFFVLLKVLDAYLIKGGAVATCSKWPKLQIFNTEHLIRQTPDLVIGLVWNCRHN